MHIRIENSSQTLRTFSIDDRTRPGRSHPTHGLSRTDYRRMVAEILG